MKVMVTIRYGPSPHVSYHWFSVPLFPIFLPPPPGVAHPRDEPSQDDADEEGAQEHERP